MASGVTSNDPEQSAAVASAYRQYADQIEQHGAVDPVVVRQLNTLGDIYADYREAKHRELTERASAHSRVANHARLLAARLESTSQAFIEQDAASATSLKTIAE